MAMSSSSTKGLSGPLFLPNAILPLSTDGLVISINDELVALVHLPLCRPLDEFAAFAACSMRIRVSIDGFWCVLAKLCGMFYQINHFIHSYQFWIIFLSFVPFLSSGLFPAIRQCSIPSQYHGHGHCLLRCCCHFISACFLFNLPFWRLSQILFILRFRATRLAASSPSRSIRWCGTTSPFWLFSQQRNCGILFGIINAILLNIHFLLLYLRIEPNPTNFPRHSNPMVRWNRCLPNSIHPHLE